MESQDIFIVHHGRRADIVLSRPHKRNALTEAMWLAVPALCRELEQARDVLVVVLRGAGDAAFSGGADIGEFAEVYGSDERRRRYNDAVEAAFDALASLGKPTIAAIHGPCVGGGCGLALACDFRLAAEDAAFAITPARLGLAYSFAATKRLVNAVGPSRAKEMLCAGRHVPAREALAIGLCNAVAPKPRLDEAVTDFASALTDVSQYAVRTMKRMVDAVANGAAQPSAALRAAWEASFSGEDFQEGYRAFLDKRKPVFSYR